MNQCREEELPEETQLLDEIKNLLILSNIKKTQRLVKDRFRSFLNVFRFSLVKMYIL